MPNDGNAPTETSPLLAKTGDNSVKPTDSENDTLVNRTASKGAPDGQPVANHDAERQDERTEPETDAKGMQDVRKRLNIAMPALAIGVDYFFRYFEYEYNG